MTRFLSDQGTKPGRPFQSYSSTGGVTALVTTSVGLTLYSGSCSGSIRHWSCPDKQLCLALRQYDLHWSEISSLALAFNDRFLSSSSKDGTIREWSLNSGAWTAGRTFESTAPVLCSAVSPTVDGVIVAGSRDSTVRVWSRASGELVRTLNCRSGGVPALCLGAKDELLFTGSNNGEVCRWNLKSGTTLLPASFTPRIRADFDCFAF